MSAKMNQNTMVNVLADNIISPLGETSEETYLAVKRGESALHTALSRQCCATNCYTFRHKANANCSV